MWDYFENKKPQGYFYFDIIVEFTIKNDHSGVIVKVSEVLFEDKKPNTRLLNENEELEISIDEYKKYIKETLIPLINSLDKFEEKELIILEERFPDVKDYVNGGSSDPIKMELKDNIIVTVSISEFITNKDNLEEYQEKTDCCNNR